MSRLKSKQIGDYFETSFDSLKADKTITFDVHLFFKQSQHLIMFIRSGETLGKGFLQRYIEKGAQRIWVHLADKLAFESYLTAGKKTAEGAFIEAALSSETLTQEEKSMITSEVAEIVLNETEAVETPEDQKILDHKSAQIVADVISNAIKQKDPLMQDIWNLAHIQPELEHSLNVGTYSALFAMAFGKIDTDLLADIAMAGLLHDVGITTIDFTVVSRPWIQHEESDRKVFSTHVQKGIDLLIEAGAAIPMRVREIMAQHHEKFDGTGYPKQLKGFAFDDVAQLVGIADFVDSISSGQWDGTPRLSKEAFKILQGFEKEKSFPVYFNPDVFSNVIQWVTGNQIDESMPKEALDVVQKDLEKLLG